MLLAAGQTTNLHPEVCKHAKKIYKKAKLTTT